MNAVRLRNPWDDEGVTPHDADVCACTHVRELHSPTRCWACYVISPRIAAPAWPDHVFHLVLPFTVPTRAPRTLLDYRPERGWDR